MNNYEFAAEKKRRSDAREHRHIIKETIRDHNNESGRNEQPKRGKHGIRT